MTVFDLQPLRARAQVRPPLALSLEAAAEALGLSVRTVRRLVASGQLPASRVGRRVLIEASALDALLTRTRIGGPA